MSQVRRIFIFVQLAANWCGKLSSVFQAGQDDEPKQRPEVKEEDLTNAKAKLGGNEPVRSKTLEVMEECGEDMLSW